MPKSQMERLWLFVGGVAAVVMLIAGWFLFIGPQRSDTSSVNGQVHTAQQQNSVLRARITQLKAENANIGQYQAEVQQAKLALPDSSGLSDFLRTLQSIGSATQTNVTSLSVGAPTTLSSAVRTTSTPTATKSAAAPANGSGVAANPLGAVYQLPITLAVTGSTSQLDEFLSQLQSVQPRAVLITQLTESTAAGAVTKSAAGGAQSLALTMQAFVAPSSAAENAQLAAGIKPTK